MECGDADVIERDSAVDGFGVWLGSVVVGCRPFAVLRVNRDAGAAHCVKTNSFFVCFNALISRTLIGNPPTAGAKPLPSS